MARIGIFCPPVPGHMNPMKVVAREMMARGHRVMFFGFADMRSRLPEDLAFVPFGEEERPVGSLQPFLDRLSRLDGIPSMRELIHDYADIAGVIFRHLPAALERDRPDAMIIDQLEYAACLVARALRLPFANVTNALPFNSEPAVPPPMFPWDYDPSPHGVQRNLAAYRGLQFIRHPLVSVLQQNAQRLGLESFRSLDQTWSNRCQLSQCVQGFDFPRRNLPRVFHYVGPFASRAAARSRLADDGRPLVFCSLGTLQGSRAEIFHSVCCAANDLDVNLLIAHGGLLTAEQAAALPGQPMVHAFAPRRAVLARCALAVTHAGFNTVMDSLGCGTPMVAMPITFEQPGIAARLQRAGAAEVLHQDRSVADVTVAMQKVLTRGLYRAECASFGAEIAQAGGVKRAGDLLEQALGLGPESRRLARRRLEIGRDLGASSSIER